MSTTARNRGSLGAAKALALCLCTVLLPVAAIAQDLSPCEMLLDPTIGPYLSGALALSLWRDCQLQGGGKEQNQAPGEQAQQPLAVPLAVERAETLVNDPLWGCPGTNCEPTYANRGQTEISAAVDPVSGTMCVAYNDAFHWFHEGAGTAGFSSSWNWGASFTDRGSIGSVESRGDPSMVWRAVDDKFYLANLYQATSARHLGLWRAGDACHELTYVGLIHQQQFSGNDDKEMMAVDNALTSPYYGRLYVVWKDFYYASPPQPLMSRYGVDDGAGGFTWSTPIVLSTHWCATCTPPRYVYEECQQGAWPAVGPNGELYVAHVEWPDPDGDPGSLSDCSIFADRIRIRVNLSTDGGNSFSELPSPMSLASNNPYDHECPSTIATLPVLNGDMRILASPQITVGANGDLHAVYSYDPDGRADAGGGPDVIDVFYRRLPYGPNPALRQWEPEVRLSTDTTATDQYYPTISASPANAADANVVVAAWYDRRHDPVSNLSFDYYVRISFDGGVTWRPEMRLTTQTSPLWLDPDAVATCYHGDYDQQLQVAVGLDDRKVHLFWSDDRQYTTPYGSKVDSNVRTIVLSVGAYLFTDGFESGDTSAWTVTLPSGAAPKLGQQPHKGGKRRR